MIRPRRGALVASVDSVAVSHLNFTAVKSVLSELASRGSLSHRRNPSPGPEGNPTVTSTTRRRKGFAFNRGGGRAEKKQDTRHIRLQEQQQPGHNNGGKIVRVVMREVEVHAWPSNWRFQVKTNTPLCVDGIAIVVCRIRR